MDAIFDDVMSQVNTRVKSVLTSQLTDFRSRMFEAAINESGIDQESADKLDSWFKSVQHHQHFGGKGSPKVAKEKKEKPKSPKVVQSGTEDVTQMKVSELKDKLRALKLPVGGTKQDLIERLQGKEARPKPKSREFISSSDEEDEPKAAKAKKAAEPKKKPALKDISDSEPEAAPVKRLTKSKKPKGSAEEKPKKSAKKTVPIVEKILEDAPELELQTDEFGRFVHGETGLVFDENEEAIGSIGPDGKTIQLTKKMIEVCKRMGVLYQMPEDVDSDSE